MIARRLKKLKPSLHEIASSNIRIKFNFIIVS